MRRLLLIALLACFPSGMYAQRMGFGASHFHGHSFQGDRWIHAGRFDRGPRSFLLPRLDPLYADYLSSTGYPTASEPPVIFLQAPPAMAVPERDPSPAQPLMIELRGNSYVQISGDADAQGRTIDATPGAEGCHPEHSGCAAKRSIHGIEGSLPSNYTAVLIFRDGHREEVPPTPS